MDYVVIIERGPTSFGAYVPDLPGCVAVGETLAEVREFIREGIVLHLDAMRKQGEQIPAPTSLAETVRVA